jgi:hypothetical protein
MELFFNTQKKSMKYNNAIMFFKVSMTEMVVYRLPKSIQETKYIDLGG